VLAPARQHVERAAERLTAAGFGVDTQVVLGHPVKRLLAEIDNSGAALAIVGSRGLDAVDRAVLGSVSDQMVRHAPATLVGR
jgi:nucleotide-binding universal stress UspA family protein